MIQIEGIQKHMKIMLKKALSLLLTAVMLLSLLSLASCGTKLVYRDGAFYCSKNKVTYKEVNYQYLPVSISKEVYAELNENGTKTDLFTLENVPPEKWLTTKDGRLFCAEDVKVPTLSEMEIDSVLICNEGSNITVSLAEIKSEESVNIVLGNIINGSELEYPVVGEADEILVLRMASKKYPWLYYSVSYVEFVEDVRVVDHVEDMNTYIYREVDESVEVTTVFEYECWYIADDDEELELLIDVAKNAEIEYGTVTKPDGNDGTLEYVGLYFKECNTFEECVETLIDNYNGTLSANQLHTLLDYPDIEEKINVVEYNYGKYLIYDRAMGKCVKADVLLHEYKDHIRND